MIIPNVFTFSTDLRADQVMSKLSAEIRTYSGLSNSEIDLERKSFRFVRRPGSLGFPLGRNPHRVILRGSVQQDKCGSRIKVWVLPSVLGSIAVALWIGAILRLVFAVRSGQLDVSPLWAAVWSMVVCAPLIGLTISERFKSREFLKGLLRKEGEKT